MASGGLPFWQAALVSFLLARGLGVLAALVAGWPWAYF